MKRMWSSIMVVLVSVFSTGASSKKTHNTAEDFSGFPKSLKEVPKDWKELLDPTTDKFWEDINGHLPEPGALKFFKSPTEENAKLYLIRMNIKRNKAKTFQKMIAKANLELIREGLIADDYGWVESDSEKSSLHDLKRALKEFTVFFFFNPQCPHCEDQAKILKGLDNVFPQQIGGGEQKHHFEGLPKTEAAKKEDIEKFTKGQVPTLLFVHTPSSKLTTVSGVLKAKEIIEIAEKLPKKGGNK
ncbi:MAG: hypothetical protein CMP11_04665 [Zetaproteobacteria bacterium]|nr:hypothetical protein [Pseudobdellovibrionaceae bacterium]